MVSSINKKYLKTNNQLQLIHSFSNGKDALDFCRQHPVDLAIVDYYMPVMDGLDFIRNCRKLNLQLDFIMITAANHAEDISTCIQLGAVDYLIKPFTYDRFQTAINRFLDRKRVLVGSGSLSQDEIDKLLALKQLSPAPAGVLLEKGLQQKTLDLVLEYFTNHSDSYFTNEEIAKEIGLSRITVRRYVNYLMDAGKLVSEIDYSTLRHVYVAHLCFTETLFHQWLDTSCFQDHHCLLTQFITRIYLSRFLYGNCTFMDINGQRVSGFYLTADSLADDQRKTQICGISEENSCE